MRPLAGTELILLKNLCPFAFFPLAVKWNEYVIYLKWEKCLGVSGLKEEKGTFPQPGID